MTNLCDFLACSVVAWAAWYRMWGSFEPLDVGEGRRGLVRRRDRHSCRRESEEGRSTRVRKISALSLVFPLGLNWKKCIVFSASNAGNEVEPGEIWEPPAIPSLISMNVPPPPKSRNRANNLQQQANHRWEQHKLTGWKGPEPPVRVQPQVHGALPPTGRGPGAWKKGGTLHSVSVPTSKSVPAHNVRPIEVFIYYNLLSLTESLRRVFMSPRQGAFAVRQE